MHTLKQSPFKVLVICNYAGHLIIENHSNPRLENDLQIRNNCKRAHSWQHKTFRNTVHKNGKKDPTLIWNKKQH